MSVLKTKKKNVSLFNLKNLKQKMGNFLVQKDWKESVSKSVVLQKNVGYKSLV